MVYDAIYDDTPFSVRMFSLVHNIFQYILLSTQHVLVTRIGGIGGGDDDARLD